MVAAARSGALKSGLRQDDIQRGREKGSELSCGGMTIPKKKKKETVAQIRQEETKTR